MQQNDQRVHFAFTLLLSSAVLAGALLYYELLFPKRFVPWYGWDLAEYLQFSLGFVPYMVLILVPTLLIAWSVGLVAPSRRPGPMRAVVCAGLVSIILWVVLGILAPDVSTQHVVYGALGIVAVSVTLLLQLAVLTHLRGLVLFQWAAVWLSAMNTLHAFAATSPAGDARAPDVRPLGEGGPQSLWAAVFVCVTCVVSQRLLPPSLRGRVASMVIYSCAAVLGPLIVYSSASPAAGSDEGSPPNFLVISVDTLRADYTSVYGGDTPTPSLERLSKRGALFWNHYSLAPWTVPSLDGTFSAMYPPSATRDATLEEVRAQSTEYAELSGYWGGSSALLPSMLRERGYLSAAYISNFGMTFQSWLWLQFNEITLVGIPYEYNRGPLERLPLLQSALSRVAGGWFEERARDYTYEIERYSRAFLRHRTRGPFFLWVHFMDPHTPYDPPDEFSPKDGLFSYYPIRATLKMTHEFDHIRDLYRGEIQHVDAAVGRILDELDRQGLAENTYVVFFSDHGEEFWDHDGSGHGHTLYQELVRVPLLLAGPDIPVVRVDTPVSSIDIIPTLADAADVPPSAQWRGKSLLPLFTPGEIGYEPSPVFIQATGFWGNPPEPLQAVVVGNYKLIRGLRTGERYLYDLDSDPGEKHNLSSALPEISDRLAGLIATWSESFPVTFEEIWTLLGTGPEPEIAQDQAEALEALGYVD